MENPIIPPTRELKPRQGEEEKKKKKKRKNQISIVSQQKSSPVGRQAVVVPVLQRVKIPVWGVLHAASLREGGSRAICSHH